MRNYVLLIAYIFIQFCLVTGHWFIEAQELRTTLICETGCVKGAVRKGFTRLILLNGRVDPDNSRLECSVYKNGFEISGYAFFEPLVADPEKPPQSVHRKLPCPDSLEHGQELWL